MSKSTKRPNRPVIFDMTSDQCVWSQAGVTQPRKCHRAFDCMGCEFDAKVQQRIAQGVALRKDGRSESWRKTLDRRPIEDRKCRHMLTGQVALKYCANNFDCARCEYDQMLADTQLTLEAPSPHADIVAGFSLPDQHYFHRGHSWARVEYGGRVRFGIDDFSGRLLGPMDQIELPTLGQPVSQNEAVIELRRGDHQATAQSPVEGVVVAVNSRVQKDATATHRAPFGSGWLVMVEPTHLRRDLRGLLYGPEAQAWLEDEAASLTTMISGETDYAMAATGGQMVDDIFGTVDGLDWDKLVQRYLVG
jgi:glycine cleavage system H lipoate-binding protein